MADDFSDPPVPVARRSSRLLALLVVLSGVALVAGCGHSASRTAWRAPQRPASPAVSPSPSESVPAAAPAPAGLPVVDYRAAPGGFPADPEPLATDQVAEGLHPLVNVAAYDAPGGQPRAFLAPTISGVKVTMPIVQERAGWVAVLLPSANRTVAWVPPGDTWTRVLLRDHLVVQRRSHTLTWYRDGVVQQSWSVTLGTEATPTPLGRTFVLGRSSLPGAVYAGTDVFALGAVPDDPGAVPTALAGAHIGLHTWYNDWTLGKNATDGCIRLTKAGQQLLLREIAPGTLVVVVDEAPQPAPTASAAAEKPR